MKMVRKGFIDTFMDEFDSSSFSTLLIFKILSCR